LGRYPKAKGIIRTDGLTRTEKEIRGRTFSLVIKITLGIKKPGQRFIYYMKNLI
jgi:hypothetical protein